MKKMWKRFVSLLLACTLLAGMLPLSASAVEKPAKVTKEWVKTIVTENYSDYISDDNAYYPLGESGLYWHPVTKTSVGEEGVVTDTILFIVPGEGATADQAMMPDYPSTPSLWNESNASALYIADGVTGIGSHAFSGMDTLEKVVFQDASDLTYVGSYAFNGDNKAKFTDERNTDEKTTLNLSSVTRMGENAFYNCDGIKGVELSGSITAVETKEEGGTEDINNKIPNHAFESCNALTSITVPEGIKIIGTAAFAGCTQASSITLPNSLVTIGDRAFMCSIDGDNKQLTSLTIPENVETIGASAFYGYTALTTVTVESTKLDKPGDAAFGDNEMSAYSGPQTVGDVTVQNGGTTFKTPNAEITKLFVNYDNCYLGPISPLTLIEEESYPAMCNKAGKNVYKYTFNNEEKQLEETLDPLQPNFTETKTIPATCTRPAYYKRTCDQWFEKDKETGKWVQTTHIHNEAIPVGGEGYEEAKGHAYEVTAISNEGHITEAGGSQVTFVCKNDCHDETRDGSEKNVNLTLTLTQQEATTLQKLSDITLPALINGTLKWNEPNAELDFDEDVQYFPVTFTPDPQKYNYLQKDGNAVEASECGETQLLVGVKVEKVELDFSAIAFDNASNLILPDSDVTTPITIRNAPEEVGDPTKILYTKTGGDASSENPPVRGEKWSGTVSVTYSYNSKDYKIDENTDFEFGTEDNPYTIEVDEGTNGQGTVTISHRYEIIPGTWEDVEATAINPTYDAVDMETVHLQGVPGGATITWQYKLKGADDSTYSLAQTVEMPSDGGNSIDIAPIETAGDYTVKVQISYAGYEPENWDTTVDVHVYKKAVAIPTAVTGLTYTGEPQTGVPVAEGTDNIYTLSDNTGIDAKGYTATATLTDEAFLNYCWQGRGEDQPTAEISWSIAKRSVLLPTVSQTKTYQYNGEYQKIVSAPIGTNFEYMFPAEGKDVEGKFPDSDIIAFTITNGQAKDVGEYPIKATLTNGNYQWVGTGAPDDGSLSVDLGEWEITPIYLTAPAFTANGKEYDGQSYAPDTLVQWQDESRAQAVAKVQEKMKGRDQFTFSHFVYNPGGATAPKDAGNYTIQAVYTYPTQNYVLQNNTSRNFIITQKSLTMQAPENQNLTYTGASHEIQGVTVKAEGLVEGDYEDAYIIKYSSQEWDKTLNDGKGGWSSSTTTYEGLPSLEHVGRYLITAKLTSKNYTAADVTYQVEISIATQTVELTGEGLQGDGSAEDPYTISKTLGNEPFTVTGKGYVGENETNAAITYESSDSDTASVDGNGQVTLKKATAKGESVTITVTAAGSANYQAATATYTITVDKGTPKIQAGDKEIPYDGAPLEEKDYQATVSGVKGAVVPSGELSYQFYNTEAGATEGGEDSKIDAPSAVGDYWLRVSYPGDVNYLPAHRVVKVTITNADLFVTPHPYAKEYDGIGHAPATFTVTGVGDVTLSADEYTVYFVKKEGQYVDTAPEAEAEGVWNNQLTVQDVADSGQFWYKIEADSYDPYVGEDPITVTVNPKPLQIKKEVTARKPYDGTKEAIVNIGELKTGVDGETVKVTDTRAEYNSPNVERADTITITYKLTEGPNTDLDNYSVSTGGKPIVGGSAEETVTTVDGTPVGITPAPITVAINDQKKVYDGSAPTVSNVKDTDWKVTYGKIYQLVSGTDDNLDITLSVAPDSKNAGTYAITGKWANSNYDVTFTGSWTGEDANNGEAGIYTITPRPISVQIGNAEGFYGDAPVKPSGLLKDISTEDGEGLVKGDSLDQFLDHVVINASPNTDVGSDYTITGTSGEYGNYNVTFASGTYTVKQRPITITISDAESDYGCDLAQLAYSETLSNTYTGSNKKVVFVGDDEDELGITLSTTAKKGSDAGTYSISGTVPDGDVSKNYSITWAGETPWSGSGQDSTAADSAKGTYTIDKAQLKVSVKRSDIYAQYGEEISNPVTFTNESTGQAIALDASDYTALSQAITYEMNPSDGLTQVEGSENAEGKFTVAVTQQMVTVTVNVAATENYEAATEITYHIHASASGSLDVSLPFADLTYNGQPQQLLAQAPELPDDVYIRYKVGEKGTWTKYSDEAPNNWQSLVGTGAGDYTVYWETKAGGNYNASSGHETTEIKKADLSATYKGLNDSEVILVLSEMRDTYTIPLDLTGNEGYTHSNGDGVTFLSGNTDVAIAKNSTATLELRGVAGEAKITINCPGDNNYNPGTFTFTVKVTDQKAEIKYNVTGATTTYNGQPQTIAVNVTAPASGATVMYWNEEAKAYDLSEPPAYTDVKDSGTTIKFQITAPGYETVTGEATLKIEPKKITETIIAGIAESYTYTGKEITFDDAISVHDEGVLLKQNTDYTVSYDQNTAVGIGSVTITGTGNYKESVTKNFTISPVDASDLTASLDRTFGYYGDSETNNATVTVTHGGHTVDSREIALTVTRQDSTIESGDVVKEGLKLTFNKAGIYTIHVVVAGTHTGTFDLTYTLLPQDVASDDFQVTTNPVGRVWTYDGENRAFGVTVTSGGTSLQKDVDFTLRYTYLPYVGSQEENEYDPESTEFTEAGIYTVIVKGTGNYTGHAELVALIQPRDLSDAGIAAAFAQTGLVYNGEAQEPEVALTYNGTAITQLKDTEYYGNTNAGEAQALSAASEDCNNFTGARVDAFTIEKKSLNDSTITAKADPEKYYYTGYPVTPAVTVTDSGRNVGLSIGADYTVSSDAVGPGKVTATVTGTGNYKDTVTVEFTILPTGAEPVETLNLTVTPSEWTWDNGQTKAAISVTFNGTELNDTDYQLTVSKDGETPKTVTKAEAVELLSAPGKYTITATGVGAYNGSTDTETVTIQKIQPTVTVTATPNSLSGGGKVTLTLKGEKLPDGTDLKNHLKVTAKNDSDVTLEDLHIQWPEDGSLTAELTLPNTSETYTFTLTFTGNEYYEAATASEQVVVAQQIISGGGGGPVEDQPANPDDTGVSDWLNTKDHLAYLAGYPGGTFGPDQNMTRAEAAQMFYNLLLEKDVEITVEFEDVPADAWYAKPVNTLASLGILSGVGNGRFDPERSITRAEFTVIAMKFANTSGGGVNIFSDVNEDDWFYSAVVDSTQYGWINGYPDGTFRPEATISRAEVTVIVNHMLGRAADRPYVIAHEEELNTFGDVNRGHWGYFHIAEATNAHEYHTEDGTESWTGLS